jgi:coenzyme F420-0:L-glutamate ligase/coenzyme F420-1:gamma-L-glutamate ligase
LVVLDDHAGRVDSYGNVLTVTAPAVADELAGAAELVTGKLSGRPFAVVRGRSDLVLPPDEDGPGATTLVRAPGGDLFGLGARDAVLAALGGNPAQRAAFGATARGDELASVLLGLLGAGVRATDDAVVVTTSDAAARWVARVAAYAHGWEVAHEDDSGVRLRPFAP